MSAVLPSSERVERGHHAINGRTAVVHTEPFVIERVARRHTGEERATLYETARTLLGAKRKAARFAKESPRPGSTVAFVVSAIPEGSDGYVELHRCEVQP